MKNATILIRYLDSDGNQIYEQTTDEPFNSDNINRQQKSIQAVGAPAIASQTTEIEILPLVLIDGNEVVPEGLENLVCRYSLETDPTM